MLESSRDGRFILTSLAENRKRRTFSEWITDFLEYDEDYEGYDFQSDDDDMRFETGNDPMPGGDEDPYYDLELDIDEGLLESMIIIGLAATLVILVYYRQQRNLGRNDNHNINNNNNDANAANNAPAEAEEEARARENDRGLFPNPGDPEYAQWLAGGVGH